MTRIATSQKVITASRVKRCMGVAETSLVVLLIARLLITRLPEVNGPLNVTIPSIELKGCFSSLALAGPFICRECPEGGSQRMVDRWFGQANKRPRRQIDIPSRGDLPRRLPTGAISAQLEPGGLIDPTVMNFPACRCGLQALSGPDRSVFPAGSAPWSDGQGRVAGPWRPQEVDHSVKGSWPVPRDVV